MNQWTSLHFFIHDFSKINHFLSNGLARLSKEQLADLFFIRYWEGGPHIRIRFGQKQNEPHLRKMMQEYWREFDFSAAIELKEYYANYQQYLDLDQNMPLRIMDNGSIHNIPYEKEYGRYGGPQGLLQCEKFFCSDSLRTLKVLAKGEAKLDSLLFYYCLAFSDAAKQAGVAYQGLLDLIGLTQKGALDFVRKKVTMRYEASGEQYLMMQDSYQKGLVYPEIILPLQLELKQLITALQRQSIENINDILSSVLHMSFNRAGIAPFKESTLRYFAHLTQTSEEISYATQAV